MGIFKKKLFILICLGFALPTLLFAGALDRYRLPKQDSNNARQRATVNESVYTDFREKISNYGPEEKDKLKEYYQRKLREAVNDKKFDAALHYGRLLDILNE